MSPLDRQAVKCINQWVEEHDGNWEAVRRHMLEDVGELLTSSTTTGDRLWALALGHAYEAMRPQAT